jgi:hypothetical protein
VDAGGAALVGGVFACRWQYGKKVWKRLKTFFIKQVR